MARKRKIPVRKHHGIRDPMKQLEEREKRLKNVTNNPPEKGGDAQLSFKFKQFKKIADATKRGKKFRRSQCGKEDKPKESTTSKKNVIEISTNKSKAIKQTCGETDKDYIKRVNRITADSLREAEYESKYGVKVVRDARTGTISIKKRPINEIDELLKQKKKRRQSDEKKKGKAIERIDPLVAKSLVKQALKEEKDEKSKLHTYENPEYKRDVFKFGEVVHAPPTLSKPKKATKDETVPRPGKKDNLLLKSILNKSDQNSSLDRSDSAKQTKSKNNKVSKVQLKAKRRTLPLATRSMLESERDKFVELYRKLKNTKQNSL